MFDFKITSSVILIVSNIDETIEKLSQKLPQHSTRIVRNEQSEKDEFLLAQSNHAIKEAYIATNSTKYILLCGSTFRKEAQNSLLKVLEEPPKNIVFIIVTTSKTNLLPTILSRMPHKFLKQKSKIDEFEFDLTHLDLKQTYAFLKKNQRISKVDAKLLVESMMYKINAQRIKLNKKELENFSTAIKLLELNSRPINVLSTLFLTLIHSKNRQ